MAYKMDPEKSGVMIYFSPMRKVAEHLDDARLGQLFRAILNYADPESQTEPDFQDEALIHDWLFLHDAIVRDDKTYHGKSLKNKYAAFCRYAKEHGYGRMEGTKYIPPITRLRWDELGSPTFSEWERMRVHADAYNAVQTHTGAVQRNTDECTGIPTSDSFPYSNSTSFSSTSSDTVSASDTRPRPWDAAEPPDGGVTADANPGNDECDECDEDKDPPYQIPTREEVRRYCRQRNLQYTDPDYYYDYYAANGWIIGAKTGNPRRMVDWKAHIRNWDAGNQKAATNVAKNGQNAADTLRALREKFKKEDGT